MNKIYFTDYNDVANYIVDNYIFNKDKPVYSISICASYDIILNILDILKEDYEVDNIINKSEINFEHPECVLSIFDGLITAEPLWNKEKYKEHYATYILIHSDCNSSVLKKFDAVQIIEFDLIENNEQNANNKTSDCHGSFKMYKKNHTLNTSYCVKFDCSNCDYNTFCGFKSNVMNMFLI